MFVQVKDMTEGGCGWETETKVLRWERDRNQTGAGGQTAAQCQVQPAQVRCLLPPNQDK